MARGRGLWVAHVGAFPITLGGDDLGVGAFCSRGQGSRGGCSWFVKVCRKIRLAGINGEQSVHRIQDARRKFSRLSR
ncbi:hypothetical protein Rhow_001480 [Rhodococcus wratislaviensis]|uniref:Uncharacterized protein n=1 Tax=Rhodococcus wratislaviensis TaxID=44752 RepID=A0A402C4D3_RHOWR|nr:hypothetical protein Rhow_001480 [Rhodococcus wratislaviensis]